MTNTLLDPALPVIVVTVWQLLPVVQHLTVLEDDAHGVYSKA